ncbi:zinc-dependent alcohol dehydrogenase family protein [Sphingopyxis sp. PET50]|uniref:zinc-dependent alcohol dehydrogenase family protein n=1 Tax=Sphingopyxis sp. PET50 TaxID=2976533 RepID=UPI0021AE4ED7|nr:NAD(P)-dependent alcohol dehydrogenase [Sphingopyxis sp. PET50]
MRFYRLRDHGSIDNLVVEQGPEPQIAPDEVRVRIRAVSLNARDLMMVFGPSPYGPKPGIIPVSDGAGEIVACGSAVTGIAPGTRVVIPFRPGWIDGPLEAGSIATDLGGAVDGVLAEQVAVAARAVVPLPDAVSFEQAAAMPCAGVTAWTALDRGAPLGPGRTVLVLGTGGVSIFALQIARAKGCRVIATTSTDAKADRLRELGARDVVNYRDCPQWSRRILELTDGRGVDRVVEVGGAGTLPQSMAALAPEGEIALIGLLADPMNQISPLPLMRTMGVIRGISVGSRADLAALVDCAATHFAPVIDRVFAFDEAPAAFAHLASRRHFGKVVIRV